MDWVHRPTVDVLKNSVPKGRLPMPKFEKQAGWIKEIMCVNWVSTPKVW